MKDYIQEFEALVAQAPNTMKNNYWDISLLDLKFAIRNQIRPLDPKDLMRAMEIAMNLEESGNEEKRGTSANWNMASNSCYTGGSGVAARAENYKGVSKQTVSSMSNTARKESINNLKESHLGVKTGEGSRPISAWMLPYPYM